ncbi:MAG TPA: membrane dipeptidase [Burkholderiales bacterium]|nr:membrane dipeptidase [Burkholderiales bacterium]
MADLLNEARDILKEAIVIDGMGGSIVHPTPHVAEGTYEEQLVGYGWTAMNSTLVSEPTYTPSYEEVLKAVNENLNYFDMSPKARLVEKTADIVEAKKNGQLAVILGMQSPSFIDQDRSRVRILHKLGLRILQMTYMERNYLGDGCLEPDNRGLTHFGIQIVRECNRLGVVMDCSHVGINTTIDTAKHSSKPILISHTAVRAIVDNPRSVTDEQMKAVADRGGVIGMTPLSALMRPEGQPTVDDYVAHFDYAIKLVGPDHVGLGTDMFDGKTKVNWVTPWYYPEVAGKATYGNRRVEGFSRKSDLANLVVAFLRKGYDRELIKKLLGGNFMRVFSEVWG